MHYNIVGNFKDGQAEMYNVGLLDLRGPNSERYRITFITPSSFRETKFDKCLGNFLHHMF